MRDGDTAPGRDEVAPNGPICTPPLTNPPSSPGVQNGYVRQVAVGLTQIVMLRSVPRLIGSLALLLAGCGEVYPSRRSMFTGGAYVLCVAGQVGGGGESGVGGQEDRSAKGGRSAGPQNERR